MSQPQAEQKDDAVLMVVSAQDLRRDIMATVLTDSPDWAAISMLVMGFRPWHLRAISRIR